MHLDLVRPGIALYGYAAGPDVPAQGLHPAFRLKSIVSLVKDIKKGDNISYGRTFIAAHDMRIATLALGYADGYPRLLSGKGVVEINGQPAHVLGRVCMDQIIVDVSHIPQVEMNSVVTVCGGTIADSMDDVASKCGTIQYESLCDIGMRAQRLYWEDGKQIALTDYLEGNH